MATHSLYDIHQSDPEIFKHFIIKNQLFVFYNCPQIDKIVKLYTNHNQLLFSLEGKRTFHQRDKRYTVTKDSSYLLKRFAFHQEIHDDIKGWKVLAFYLKDDYIKKVLDEYRQFLDLKNLPNPDSDMLIQVYLNDKIRECYLSMTTYFEEGSRHPEDIIEMKFKELLYNIFSYEKNRQVLAYVNAISNGYQTPIWEVMENNFTHNLQLKEFAKIANRSLSKFKTDFQNHYKTTPGKWLLNKRLEHAKSLLSSSPINVSESAFESGFENNTHFSRVFKEKFGISPSDFKKSV